MPNQTFGSQINKSAKSKLVDRLRQQMKYLRWIFVCECFVISIDFFPFCSVLFVRFTLVFVCDDE